MSPRTHATIDPAILYFGTPVVLITTLNADGSANIAPMSSAWWLGRSCMLGLSARGHTAQNLQRTGECVLNLPSVAEADAVNRLAKTTGSDPVPPYKVAMGYRHVRDKFAEAGLTAMAAELVRAPRIRECPVHLEATLEAVHPLAVRDDVRRGGLLAFEMRIARVHVDEQIRLGGHANRVDPDRWRPLMMSFQQFYGLGEQVLPSRLAEIDEESYRPKTATPVRVPVLTA